MNRKFTHGLFVAVFSVGMMGVASANPVTFDFGAAAIGHEQGNPNESDATPIGLRFDGSGAVFTDGFSGSGLQVIATGQNIGASSGNPPYAYLDGPLSGRQAGLGVCQNLNSGNQCGPNDDDNVTGTDPTEQLTLTFNSLVTLSGLTFKGEKHYGVGTGHHLGDSDTLLLNGSPYTFDDAETASLTGNIFTFAYGGNKQNQFYLGTVTAAKTSVPEPGALGLFGFSLLALGLAGLHRRRSEI